MALFRPGPLQSGMVEDFIARKHSRSDRPIDYLHPDLRQVLTPTYGVILYQEQVMQIAQMLAGYTLGGADLLRRAMGKKKAEEMAKQRSVFIDGAVARDGAARARRVHLRPDGEVRRLRLQQVALGRLRDALLPDRLPQGALSGRVHGRRAVGRHGSHRQGRHADRRLRADRTDGAAARRQCLGACLRGGRRRTIRYGLGAIKGVGRSAVDALVEERDARGAYASLEDLCHRVDLQRVNRRVLEALIRSGSCDSLGPNRAALMERLGVAMQAGEQSARTVEAGQDDFFGLPQAGGRRARCASRPRAGVERGAAPGRGARDAGPVPDRSSDRALRAGSGAAGRRAHPRFGRRSAAGRRRGRALERRTQGRCAGLILEIRRRGPRVSFVLDDRSGRIEVTMSEEMYQRFRDLVVKDALVLVEGSLRFDEFSDAWRVQARSCSRWPRCASARRGAC